MKYQLDYAIWVESECYPGVFRKEHGSLEFANVHAAQEWCESPVAMLEQLGAERGEFMMRVGERPFAWEWLWEMAYDVTADMNRIPGAYRAWRDAIYGREE